MDKAQHQQFSFGDWSNGTFLTSTISGTRPAGAVAGAWATFQFLGVDGYKLVAHDLMSFVDRYKAAIREIRGLHILRQPHLSLVAYGSDEFDVFRIAELMSKKGWLPGLVQRPKGIHRMMSMMHADSLSDYVSDLKAAVGVVRQSGQSQSTLKASY